MMNMGLKKRVYTDQETIITADNLNDIQDSIIALEDGAFSCTAKGESIVVTDSSSNELLGLNLYGKSTQSGTPTPAAPIDIVSVGDDGSITVGVYGGNLYDFSKVQDVSKYGLTVSYLNDGGIKIIGTPTQTFVAIVYDTTTKLPKGSYFISGGENASGKVYAQIAFNKNGATVYNTNKAFTIDGTEENVYISITTGGYTGYINYTIYPMLNSGTTKMSSVAYKQKQSIDLTAPLRAIPVTDKSLATYTDASGQMWCADEIDLERGVYIQRIKTKKIGTDLTFNQTSTWGNSTAFSCSGFMDDAIKISGYATVANMMSKHFVVKTPGQIVDSVTNAIGYGESFFYISVDGIADAASLKSWIEENEPTAQYILATPIETNLTDEEIAAYKALYTNKPNTTVLNDSGAYMSMKYIADPKSYIDKKISSAILAATVE